jgi:hypothetical protein
MMALSPLCILPIDVSVASKVSDLVVLFSTINQTAIGIFTCKIRVRAFSESGFPGVPFFSLSFGNPPQKAPVDEML